MSDIAMLVAEEYERRVSILRKARGGCEVAEEKIDMFWGARVLAERLIKEKWAWEPKTQVAIAASTSFFSA